MVSSKEDNSQAYQHKPPTLLVMAGGTGGHIFPGIAVADELKAQGWNIHWLGTADRMEANIVPDYGYDISFIKISGMRGKKVLAILTMPFKLVRALIQAKRVIKKVQPDVVLGMGGYASAPGGLAAWLSNIPLIVHEQNAAAGLSNRLLARIANKVCCAFPNAFAGNIVAEVVGNPLRASIAQQTLLAKSVKNDKRTKNILVVGGSLGAQVLNNVMPSSFASLASGDERFYIWHQTGAGNKDKVSEAYAQCHIATDAPITHSSVTNKVKVTEFITDMAAAYQWADLVICRAGALTVSELAMAAKPAIFVPLPHAVDDHQTKNALFLVNLGGARLLPQSTLNHASVTALITELFDQEDTLATMASASFGAASNDASKKVATLCQQLLAANDTALSNNEEKI
ncbi:undecaprenyldiphospho-muramoylpentapeptide beta-N-acetylglucosaminyltransferase [Colwellia ponticola]|uniref:UDP-N-acetylglucosamine--N-acetylmuramyl-(pentapeptide) pyrophosphoryl-undecaprenol N-acetylglucosamine transferase n=1 Tax=Colwellia ponticola TaxID=2304625 RepID=A0A8H2JP33_9GAMM|nr:undecaprenyldiphospho-muramoylpentapeptide beta-N-acetylglucosaminyltransferase [Colwellia ponticola]TMM47742.1 undecaprenyldiphospho-muramoylpentapeptide beta-N-acetylglucosaminyltransferase [Colwellia ponticola]